MNSYKKKAFMKMRKRSTLIRMRFDWGWLLLAFEKSPDKIIICKIV